MDPKDCGNFYFRGHGVREAIDPDIKKFIDDYYDIDFTHFGYEKEIK
mgnify:CR=1 FL=1|tara:strand:- start:504 stop:644 length:141 start_codon:yes stop_codon:yes gene_type:complete